MKTFNEWLESFDSEFGVKTLAELKYRGMYQRDGNYYYVDTKSKKTFLADFNGSQPKWIPSGWDEESCCYQSVR